MDYDEGKADLGLGSALDALLADASLSVEEAHPVCWDERSGEATSVSGAAVLRVSPSTEGRSASPRSGALAGGGAAAQRVSPEDGALPARALFGGGECTLSDDDDDSRDEEEEEADASAPPSDFSGLRSWAAGS